MARSSSQVMQPRVLLSGLAMPESPRWHEGRLWFSNWGADQIVAVDLDGSSEVVGRGPEGEGWAVNWLPDNRMLITGSELVRVEPDGSRVRHADLSHLSPYGWSEITVDGRGNVYVNTINFDFADFDTVLTSGQAPGKIALVTPDGEVREVARELAFPNGMVITPDNTDPHRRRIVRCTAHRLRHRRGRHAVESTGLGRRASARTASAWTPTGASGPPAAA